MDKLDLDRIELAASHGGNHASVSDKYVLALCAEVRRLQAAALPVEEQGPRPVEARRPHLDSPLRPAWDAAAAITRMSSGQVLMLANRILEMLETLAASRPKAEEGKAVDRGG